MINFKISNSRNSVMRAAKFLDICCSMMNGSFSSNVLIVCSLNSATGYYPVIYFETIINKIFISNISLQRFFLCEFHIKIGFLTKSNLGRNQTAEKRFVCEIISGIWNEMI